MVERLAEEERGKMPKPGLTRKYCRSGWCASGYALMDLTSVIVTWLSNTSLVLSLLLSILY